MSRSRSLSLWGVSLLLVLGLHLGLACWALLGRPQSPPVELPPAAMMVELEPAPVKPPPPPKIEPEPEPEPEPKLVEAPKPTIALAKPKPVLKPKPKPQQEKPPEPKPPQPTPEKSEEDADPLPTDKASAPQAAEAPSVSVARQQARQTWQSQLQSRLARFQKYPEAAKRREKPGIRTSSLRFTVDAEGRVLAYELVGRSGNPLIDRATLEVIRKAQPLPKPPPELLNGGTLEIIMPLSYELKRT
jgi:protein TonB